jgi:DNA oxidative demethylase
MAFERMQPSLFSSDPSSDLAGLDYRDALIDGAEEATLVRAIKGLDLKPFEFHGFLGNRRTAAFGSRYDFSRERVEAAPPIPAFLQPLRAAAAGFAGLEADELEHVLVTEYAPGAGIGWHRDKPQYDQVIGVSLLAPCVLRFRRRTERGWERRSLPLAPRSAYRLSGPVRDHWEHSITPMSVLRYSVTFRSRRQG